MKRFIPAGVAVACLASTATAFALQTTPSPVTVTAAATASKGMGTKQAPKGVGAGITTGATTSDGSRPESAKELRSSWAGIVSNGKHFPKCTVDQIDMMQSDSTCPKGSLVAKGTLKAVIGPEADFDTPGANCVKEVRVYNAGANQATVLLVGSAADCVGVGYLPPFPATWSKAGGIDGGQTLVTPIPSNISHPLPGVLGSTTQLTMNFMKQSVKFKGKKEFYLSSVGCKGGKRKFTQVVVGDPSNKIYTTKTTAGAC